MLQLNKFIFDDINWMHTLSMSTQSRIKQITLKDWTAYVYQWLDDEKMVEKNLPSAFIAIEGEMVSRAEARFTCTGIK